MNDILNALGVNPNNKSTIEQLYDSIDTSAITKDIGEIVSKNNIASVITKNYINSTADKLKKLIPSKLDADKLLANPKGAIENKGLMYQDICYSALAFQLENNDLISKEQYKAITDKLSKRAIAGLYNSNKKDRVVKALTPFLKATRAKGVAEGLVMTKPDNMVKRVMNKAYDIQVTNVIDAEKISKQLTTVRNTVLSKSDDNRNNHFETKDSLKKIKPELIKSIDSIIKLLNTK